jgi:hypothetical protein
MPDGTAHPDTIQAEAEAIVADQQAAFDRFVPEGVRWSAMHRDAPVVETVDAVAARLRDRHAKVAAFRASPRGRFLTAVDQLQDDGGHDAQAIALRGLYNRSLSDDREALDVPAVGRCLLILNPIDTQAAQEASNALADLLIAAAPAKAA